MLKSAELRCAMRITARIQSILTASHSMELKLQEIQNEAT